MSTIHDLEGRMIRAERLREKADITAINKEVNETTAVSDHYPVYADFWRDRDADVEKEVK